MDYFDSVLIRELKREDFVALDKEILDWYDTVPEKIRIQNLGNHHVPVPGTPTYDIDRLQIWTRLRLNQVGDQKWPETRHGIGGGLANKSSRYESGCTHPYYTAPPVLHKTMTWHNASSTLPRRPSNTLLD